MANHYSHSLRVPVKNALYNVPLLFLDADGDPVVPTNPVVKVSKDFGAFATCANALTTVGTGFGYVTLNATEMNCVEVLVECASDNAKKAVARFTTVQYAQMSSGTAQAGDTTTITLASTASAVNAYNTGCLIKTTGGTGGATDARQARFIRSYDPATKIATVDTPWETVPSSDTTYIVYFTEWRPNIMGANIGVGGILATSFAADAIDADALATDGITEIVAAMEASGTKLYRVFCRVLGKKITTDGGDGTITTYAEDGTTPVDVQTKGVSGDQTTYTRT